MRSYEALKAHVESRLVHDLAADAACLLHEGDFVISAVDQDNLDHEYWSQRLREYLLGRATSTKGTHSSVAKRLGVSRQTLYEWQKGTSNPK